MTELVRGEASESDEEIDRGNIFGSEIPGEATESDEDLYEKKVLVTATEEQSAETLFRNNLLQRKLIENNVAIYKGMGNFVNTFITAASKQLLCTDKLLIKSQVIMQSVVSSLKNTQMNMLQLHEKTYNVVATNFIPNINI